VDAEEWINIKQSYHGDGLPKAINIYGKALEKEVGEVADKRRIILSGDVVYFTGYWDSSSNNGAKRC
jgi:hypothetical protein